MIVDTSAVVAVLTGEPERDELLRQIETGGEEGCRMSVANYLECAVVVDGCRDPVLSRHLDVLLESLRVELCAVDEEQARVARRAYTDFGRGSGHPARLNFGDCFAYALASTTGEALVFKGEDFTHTDVRRAGSP